MKSVFAVLMLLQSTQAIKFLNVEMEDQIYDDQIQSLFKQM